MNPLRPRPKVTIGGGDTAQPLNLQKRMALIQRYAGISGKHILDGGCGAGSYVIALQQSGANAWGVEYSPEKVAQFQLRYPEHPERVQQGDLERLPFADATFDVALLNEVLEHVPDDSAALREVLRVIRPGGRLLIFSPNRRFPFETHGVNLRSTGRRLAPAIPFIPYIPIPIGRLFFEYWARNYWPGELRRLAVDAGFRVVHTTYVWLTFENISGRQPGFIRALRPLLRGFSKICEALPIVSSLGTSQLLVLERPQP
jgi:ubiquinone/menaquinone biosynthesis C-methylase UbiE